MSKWSEYYESDLQKFNSFEEYYETRLRYKMPLIRQVRLLADGGRVVELGCGTGLSCIKLAKDGLHVVGVEKNKEMLRIAMKNNQRLHGKAKFCKGSIENWTPAGAMDIAFNNGVMEHFSDEQIVRIINHVLSYSRYYIIGIPTGVFKPHQAINGDERFMKLAAWRKIVASSDARIVDEIYYNSSLPFPRRVIAMIAPDHNQFAAFVLERR